MRLGGLKGIRTIRRIDGLEEIITLGDPYICIYLIVPLLLLFLSI